MPRTVLATYRVQLHADFGFDALVTQLDYLAALGISHVYCSPYLQAAAGSTHGYDVVDHHHVNDELGGETGRLRLLRALEDHRLGQVLDIVPNHMAISTGNRWWMDVLENGASSHYDEYFDLDWAPPEVRLRDRVLVPVLADHYGRVLHAGEITMVRQGARFEVHYGDHRYPIDLSSVGALIARAAERCGSDALAFIGDDLSDMPGPTTTHEPAVTRRHRDKAVLEAQLHSVLDAQPACAAALDSVIGDVNADRAALHGVLESQSYRLAWWRSAGRDLGYRRFFDVNMLVGLRVEDERVFEDTHRRVLDWIKRGELDGLRIDHPDGLRDPQAYCERLRRAAPDQWIVLEKVLAHPEQLPCDWPVAGTTGYDFLNRALGVFIDPAGESRLTEFYGAFTGEPTDYQAVVLERKQHVLRDTLGSDVNRLADLLVDVTERYPTHRDYSRHQLTEAIREIVVSFPVYRTYVRPGVTRVRPQDREHILRAVEDAAGRRADLEHELFAFVGSLLLLDREGPKEHEFVARFQQLTGPAMAKGVEDTAFYTFNRFIALNEVGGDPSQFGLSPEAFHAAASATQRQWPQTMLTTATHDTKRGEDVRARLALLSEIPDRWVEAVTRWAGLAERYRRGDVPDRNTEYFFYQTLVGAWPLEIERARAYMEKAIHEAKTRTSWTMPDEDYDRGVDAFVTGVMRDRDLMAEIATFVAILLDSGRVNALAQTLLKLTAPGTPDVYQGTELWSLSLVDPDNRRPVDFSVRRRLLKELTELTPETICQRADEGLPKLWVLSQALGLRARRPDAFGPASVYEPLSAQGDRAHHVLAFSRDRRVISVVPRLGCSLKGDWGLTELPLPVGVWRDVLTGDIHTGDVRLSDLLRRFPVSLLERIDTH